MIVPTSEVMDFALEHLVAQGHGTVIGFPRIQIYAHNGESAGSEKAESFNPIFYEKALLLPR